MFNVKLIILLVVNFGHNNEQQINLANLTYTWDEFKTVHSVFSGDHKMKRSFMC